LRYKDCKLKSKKKN